MKKFKIISEIVIVVVYIAYFATLLWTGPFKNDNDIMAVVLLINHWTIGFISLSIDLTNGKRLSACTVGSFILGLCLFLGFAEKSPFNF